MAGHLIALEGLDGAGTTTQAERLLRRLATAQIPAIRTFEPSSGTIGRLLRKILAGTTNDSTGDEAGQPRTTSSDAIALLFAADRMDHVTTEILPALQRGETVVTDRYILSSLAYQARDGGLQWIQSINSKAPAARLTVYVRVSVDCALGRLEGRDGGREIYEKRDILERVHAQYERVVGDWPDRAGQLAIIDGSCSVDAVESAIWEAVGPVVLGP